MLHTFLKHIAAGKYSSLSGIAEEMGISQAMAADLAQKLVDLGYLQLVGEDACGDSACADCPAGGACLTGGRRGFMLTEKGKHSS